MNKNDTKTKQLVCVLLAASSFIVILLFCMRLQARGLPIIACLAVHTICMFILWKDALNQAESDDDDTFNWASPSEQENTLPVLESPEQEPSAAVSETDIAEGEAVPAETDKREKATISDEAVEQEREAASEESRLLMEQTITEA
ncbi:MAG: hypothetical protein Q4C06_05470, partial [Bacillota bacterium]|nr:hypothetical protein [Bacillota bacterium]